MKRSILLITPHRPNRAPSQRFRFEQYLEFLKTRGIDHQFSYLVSQKDDQAIYSSGKYLVKFYLFFKFFFIRLRDVFRANQYQWIFIQREAFFAGPAFFEYLLSRSRAKLIYDFDDSIWLKNVSDGNKSLGWIKNFHKTQKIVKYADLVFAGNKYLADFALQFNNNVVVVPTTIDTEEYNFSSRTPSSTVRIGWSGSVTTIMHFNYAVPFLKRIKDKYGDAVSIIVIGDKNYHNQDLNISGIAWDKQSEISELEKFDIGIMPLPDDEWAKGKCGLKGLQYMALGIPTIMSPVGVNTEIIQDGINGFLAESEDEWVEKLSLLIDESGLRQKLGAAGRKTVEENYSSHAWKNRYFNEFDEIGKK